MQNQWCYTRDGRLTLGPVTWQELRLMALAGEISPSDVVGHVGMAEPMRAGGVDGLFTRDRPPVGHGLPMDCAAKTADRTH